MMRDDRRRRSPESSRRRRKERRDSREQLAAANMTMPLPMPIPGQSSSGPPPQPQIYAEPERMRSHVESSSDSSSSTSSSFLNISRKPMNLGGLITTFFRAPTEHRHRRRRKKTRILGFGGNSSSSSLNSDLAYGHGYIRREKGRDKGRDKSRRLSPRNSVHAHSPSLQRSDPTNPNKPPPPRRAQTDEEILEIGRQLSEIARQQNDIDLRAAGKIRPSQLVTAASAYTTFRRQNTGESLSRGIGGSKPHHGGGHEDSEWESATDDEDSFSDDGDSGLAYGSTFKPSKSARISSNPPENIRHPEKKSSIVDPRLFGPVNSLRGAVNTPCGFGEEDPRAVGSYRRHHEEAIAQAESADIEGRPMQRVYAVPTSDPDKFDFDHGSLVSTHQEFPHRSRPAPVPLQQPIPKVPVSSKVFDADRYVEEERRASKGSRRHSEGKGLAEAAVAGVTVAAIGAAIASGRKEKDSRDYRRDEPKDDRPERKYNNDRDDRVRREKDEYRKSSNRDSNVKIVDERDHKRSGHEDDRYETSMKRREIAPDSYREKVSYKLPDGDEIRVEYDRDKDRDKDRRRRDETKEPRIDDRKMEKKDERRDSKRGDKSTELPRDYEVGIKNGRHDSKKAEKSTDLPRDYKRVEDPELPGSRAPIDPFQFQVEDDAFQTPLLSSTPALARPLTPAIVTVDREPNFDDPPARQAESSDSRLSRKDSFEIEQRLDQYRKGSRDRSRTPEPRRRRSSYERESEEAQSIYNEAKHATAGVGVAAMTAAIAVEEERSRGRRRGDNSEVERDTVQEEADRYYRETVIARRIAADEIRSRSASPHDPSVVGKWDEDQEPEIVTIVTPPEMENPLEKSPYDAPNADVRIDHVIVPKELSRFRTSDERLGPEPTQVFRSRDPSAERERPLLNLVLPTPSVTPSSTPNPEKQMARAKAAESGSEKTKSTDKSVPDVVISPRGEIIQSPSTPTSKSVTWGENETKSFEAESPDPPKSEDSKQAAEPTEKPAAKTRPRIGKNSKWGLIAAALGGGIQAAASDEKDVADSNKDKGLDRDDTSDAPTSRTQEPAERAGTRKPDTPTIYHDEPADLPPAPGPKPASPRTSQMPGAFADDLEFAATLAAGLQDTGFDPNIVIDDPTYRRRDSPPGSNGPISYHQPFAETVTDLGIYGAEDATRSKPTTSTRSVVEEVSSTPTKELEPIEDEWEALTKSNKKGKKNKDKAGKRQSVDSKEREVIDKEPIQTPDEFDEWSTTKPSKKDQKKRDKAGKSDVIVVQEDSPAREEIPSSQPRGAVDEEWEEPSRKKKSKKSRKSTDLDDADDKRVSVPIDAFDDIRTSREAEPADEWDVPKKSKKSKRDSVTYDSPSRSAPASEVSVENSSKKGKKSRRKSGADDFEDDNDGDPPDKGRDSFTPKDRDVSSVVSDPMRYDDDRYERRSNGSRYDDGDETRSVASAPDGVSRRRSTKDSEKRSSKEQDKRSSGTFFGLFGKSNGTNGKDEDVKENKKKSDKDDKNSFLDNAGTFGAGVGLASAVAAIGSTLSRSHATDSPSEKGSHDVVDVRGRSASPTRDIDIVDPEIVQRVIKPAIDPQYGDLLPLPPSEPGSPKENFDELPELPDSRPSTPPEDRNLLRERFTHSRRRSAVETPIKTPSHTAIPIQLRLGQRSVPSSPGFLKSSPIASPTVPATPKIGNAPKRLSRPTSWDSSREIKPLYLAEHTRQGSNAQHEEYDGMDLPELPPSEPPSERESPGPDYGADHDYLAHERSLAFDSGLHIDTSIPTVLQPRDTLGSEDSTPKAEYAPRTGHFDDLSGTSLAGHDEQHVLPPISKSAVSQEESYDDLADLPPLPASPIGASPLTEPSATLAVEDSQRAIGIEASTEDFIVSSKEPDAIESMSKNRSSYLLHSTPPSLRKTNERDLSDGSPSLTPTKRRDDVSVMPQIGEGDSTSHAALGALAGVGVGGLIASSLLSRDEEQTSREISDNHTLASSTDVRDVSESDLKSQPRDITDTGTPSKEDDAGEFGFFSSKKSKKGKKGRKGKAAEVDDDLPAPSAEIASPLPIESFSSAADDVTAPLATEQPVEEYFETKASKKNKKKLKRAQTWEPDLADDIVQESSKAASDTEVMIPQDDASQSREAAEDMEADVLPVLERSNSSSSKKAKKKKGKKFSAWDPDPDDITPAESQPEQKSLAAPADDIPEIREATATNDPDEFVSTSIEPDHQVIEPELATPNEPSFTPARKGKKKKGSKASSWDPEPEDTVSQDTEPQQESLEITHGIAETDFAMDQPRHIETGPLEQTTAEMETTEPRFINEPDSTFTPAKKGKKNKGRKSVSWEPEDEPPHEPLEKSFADENDRIFDSMSKAETFETPESSYRIGESWATTPEVRSESQDVVVHEATLPETATPVHKPEILERNLDNQVFEPKSDLAKSSAVQPDDIYNASPKSLPFDSVHSDAATPQVTPLDENKMDLKDLDREVPGETGSTKPTPIGGPGYWPITPATADSKGDIDYFPSSAGLNSPQDAMAAEPDAKKSYFPSALRMLPVTASFAAVGAAFRKVTGGQAKEPEIVDEPSTSGGEATQSQGVESLSEPGAHDKFALDPEIMPGERGLAEASMDEADVSAVGEGDRSVGNKSIADTRNPDAQPVDPTFTDSALEAGDQQPIAARNNLDQSWAENTLTPEPSLPIPASNDVQRESISEDADKSLDLEMASDVLAARPDDEWQETTVGKKGKKNKKNKQRLSLADVDSSVQDITDPASALTETPVSAPKDVTNIADFPLADEQPQTEPSHDDLWSEPIGSTKKSKKKQKKDASSRFILDDVESSTIVQEPQTFDETSEQTISQISPEVASENLDLSSGFDHSQPIIAGEDEWDTQPVGKKGKKGKKRSSIARSLSQADEPQSDSKDTSFANQVQADRGVDESHIADNQDQREAPVDFSFVTAGSKKSKKNQKRQSLLETATEDSSAPAESILEQASDPAFEEATAAAEGIDQGFETQGKKGKKGKKKRQSIPFEDFQDSFEQGPSREMLNEPAPSSESADTAIAAEDLSLSSVQEGPSQTQEQVAVSPTTLHLQGVAEGKSIEEPAPAVAATSIQPQNDDQEAATLAMPDQAVEPEFKSLETTSDSTEAVQQPQDREMSIHQAPVPELADDFVTPVYEDDVPFSVKKSKKDKKKKKGAAQDAIEESQIIAETSTPVLDIGEQSEAQEHPVQTLATENEHLVAPLDEDKPSLLTEQTKRDNELMERITEDPQGESIAATRAIIDPAEPQPTESATPNIPTTEPEQSSTMDDAQEEFPFVVKKSKKDKKKKGKSQDIESGTSTPAILEVVEPSSTDPWTKEPEQEKALPLGEDEYSFTTKRSKKDKKKKKGKFQDDPETLSETATPAETPADDLSRSLVLPDISTEPSQTATSTEALASEDIIPESQSSRPQEEPIVDEWAEDVFTTKKSKKDKKKRKSKVQDDTEPESGVATPLPIPGDETSLLPVASDTVVASEGFSYEPAIQHVEETVSEEQILPRHEDAGTIIQSSPDLESIEPEPIAGTSTTESAIDNISHQPEDQRGSQVLITEDTGTINQPRHDFEFVEPEPAAWTGTIESAIQNISHQPEDQHDSRGLITEDIVKADPEPLPTHEANQETEELQETFFMKTSKKDKRKKRATLTETEPEVISPPNNQPAETKDLEEGTSQAQDLQDSQVTIAEPISTLSREETSATAVADDDWSEFVTSKKSKKDKKKKKRESLAWAEAESSTPDDSLGNALPAKLEDMQSTDAVSTHLMSPDAKEIEILVPAKLEDTHSTEVASTDLASPDVKEIEIIIPAESDPQTDGDASLVIEEVSSGAHPAPLDPDVQEVNITFAAQPERSSVEPSTSMIGEAPKYPVTADILGKQLADVGEVQSGGAAGTDVPASVLLEQNVPSQNMPITGPLQQLTSIDEVTASHQESLPIDEDVTAKSGEQDSRALTEEPQEFFTVKKSKKDKKKRGSGAASISEQVSSFDDNVPGIEHHQLSRDENEAADYSTTIEPNQEDRGITEVAEGSAADLFFSKKSKKSKKESKRLSKSNADSDWSPVVDAVDETRISSSAAAGTTIPEAQDILASRDVQDADPFPTQPTGLESPRQESDFGGFQMSQKKSKKGKKGKASRSEVESESTSRALSPTHESNTPAAFGVQETTDVVETERPTEYINDEWDVPTTKKSKKDKKRKPSIPGGSSSTSRNLSPTREYFTGPVPEVPDIPPSDLVPSAPQTPRTEDSWDYAIATKPKKGKKGRKASLQADTDEVSPRTSVSRVDREAVNTELDSKHTSADAMTREGPVRSLSDADIWDNEDYFKPQKRKDSDSPSGPPPHQTASAYPTPSAESHFLEKVGVAAVAGAATVAAVSTLRESDHTESATDTFHRLPTPDPMETARQDFGMDSHPSEELRTAGRKGSSQLSQLSSRTADIDLTPAQESSRIVHEAPFDQTARPGKKVKTREPSSTTLVEPILSSRGLAAAYLEDHGGHESSSSHDPAQELTITKDEPLADTKEAAVSKQNIGYDHAHAENSYWAADPLLEEQEQELLREGRREKNRKNESQGTNSARDMAASYLERKADQAPADTGMSAKPITSSSPKSGGKLEPDNAEALAAAGALSGGVALLAQKFGGGKKKASKKKKLIDKRAPQEDDLFDDPALWEGAEKKFVSEVASAEVESFWGTEAVILDKEATQPVAQRDVSGDIWPSTKPLHQEHIWAEEDDNLESPILGRDIPRETPRLASETRDTAPSTAVVSRDISSGNNREIGLDEAVSHGYGYENDQDLSREVGFDDHIRDHDEGFRRSLSRGLPSVREESREDLAVESRRRQRSVSRGAPSTPEVNRDSGFVTDSPHPLRRSNFGDQELRDSGVHLRDWNESTSQRRDIRHSPEPSWPGSHGSERHGHDEPKSTERKLGKSPLAEHESRERPMAKTPKLCEPTARDVTPEPQKARRISPESDTPRSKYQDLGVAAAAGAALAAATSGRSSSIERRSVSDKLARHQSPVPGNIARRSSSNTSISRHKTPEPLKFRPESPGMARHSATPPLRARRVSGDLRSLSQRSQLDLSKDSELTSQRSIQNITPTANEGRVRAKDMTDVYDGFGEGRIGSPRSPTRPHSMRRRQSMQVLELESRVDQLIAENRMLSEARAQAESHHNQRASGVLAERDAEIDVLKQSLEFLQKEVARLTEVNTGLNSANTQLATQHNDRYRGLEAQHASASLELEEARNAHGQFQGTLQEKDAEIDRLRAELEAAKEQIREMQRKILETKPSDIEFLNIQDVDHFDHRCQQLCSHVQQWVLRFSKFSDMRACRLTSEINDEKVIDRLDNAVLDGSDVDSFLGDRVKRRDIFMSMTMNMIWEFVFTRYLFGMDREQRQKLKSLEKLLMDVGPPQAVRQWRAVTLTLLSRRETFKEQCDLDTEAVVQAVFQTLSKVLPPPSNLEDQIQSQLRRVMKEAVDLSVEMRTQRAEYMMLPPLQPEYDADGELAETVTFNASLMNERSGDNSLTNEELESQNAVVRIVIFPLVVKKGDDNGVGEEEIVVCPAQVLVAKTKSKGRDVRMFTPSSDAGGASLGAPTTTQSNASVRSDGTEQPEAEYLEGGI